MRSGRNTLRDISFYAAAGESVALVGPSGAGKTTVLKSINGRVTPSSGSLSVGARELSQWDIYELRRVTATILQGIGLFPHLSVAQNVRIVPELLKWSEERIEARTAEMLEAVRLPIGDYGSRSPRTLSGGEQQRVGIARALAGAPELLLCDEPFTALDPILRREQQDLLLELSRQSNPTIIFVTHDLAEATRIAKRVIVMDDGRVVADVDRSELTTHAHPVVRKLVEASRIER